MTDRDSSTVESPDGRGDSLAERADTFAERVAAWFDGVPTVPLDGGAAARATAVAVVVVAALVVIQGAVTAAATGGHQPMPQVERIPDEPTSGAWQDAPSETVSLSAQQMATPFGGGSTDEVTVRALTNETHVAFRLSWTDPTNDTSLNEPGAYSDAAAVMLRGGESPPITMGAAGDPVNVWYWRANWQYGDEPAEWTGDMYGYPHPDEETRPGTQAGNPLSRGEYDAFGQNYYAEGPGSISYAQSQNVDAQAARDGDEWSVTFTRERSTEGSNDAAFDEHDQMYLAFAVWNGSADEVNGKKSLTLQFTTLDTQAGDLAPADTGGGSDGASGGDGSGSDDGDGGDGGPFGGSLGGFVGSLVAAALLSWLVIYWRAAR